MINHVKARIHLDSGFFLPVFTLHIRGEKKHSNKRKERFFMPNGVKCSVNSCHFWKQGNKCAAEKIQVNMYSEERAYKSGDTGCKTFRPADFL